MDQERRKQLIKQRSVARGMLSRIQTFIETGEPKVHDIQVRFNKLPDIFTRYDNAQSELELSDDTDQFADRESFENQFYQVEAKFSELLHPVVNPQTSLQNSPHSSLSENSNQLSNSHSSGTHTKLPTIALPTFEGDTCSWLHFKDPFEALIVHNTTLSNVQKLHYLISSLKGEAKALIGNLPITNENFKVAWELVTQRNNNVKLIAMTHVKQLLQLPLVKRNDATSLRHLINHVSSNLNAIQALQLETSTHDLIMNHLLLSVLDSDTHNEWELQTAALPDIPATPDVIKFLEDRCKALELLQANQPTGASTLQRSTPTGNKVSHPNVI